MGHGRAAPELGDGLFPSLLLDPRPARIVLQAPRERETRRFFERLREELMWRSPPCRAGTRLGRGRSAGQDGIPIPRGVAPAPRTACRACTRTAGCPTDGPAVPGRPLGRSACPVRAYGDHSSSDTTCDCVAAQAPYPGKHGIGGRCVSIHNGIRTERAPRRTAPSRACEALVPSRTRVRVRARAGCERAALGNTGRARSAVLRHARSAGPRAPSR